MKVFFKFLQRFCQILASEADAKMFVVKIVVIPREQQDAFLLDKLKTKFLTIPIDRQARKRNGASFGGNPVEELAVGKEKPVEQM